MNDTPDATSRLSARLGERMCSGDGMIRPTSAKLNPASNGEATEPVLSAAAG